MTEKVWVLYNEEGCYSDYSMNIEGVFSSAEIAMASYDAYNSAKDFEYIRRATGELPVWKHDEEDGNWHKNASYAEGFMGSIITVKEFPIDWIRVWNSESRDFRIMKAAVIPSVFAAGHSGPATATDRTLIE